MLPPEESSVWVDRIIKFGALLVTSPIWIRILKAMFHEIQSTLRDEGGLFGKDYSRRERAKIEERYGPKEITLSTETWEQHRHAQEQRGKGRSRPHERGGGAGSRGTTRRRPANAQPRRRRKGF